MKVTLKKDDIETAREHEVRLAAFTHRGPTTFHIHYRHIQENEIHEVGVVSCVKVELHVWTDNFKGFKGDCII